MQCRLIIEASVKSKNPSQTSKMVIDIEARIWRHKTPFSVANPFEMADEKECAENEIKLKVN